MIFLLIRLAPFIVPVAYFLLLRLLFVATPRWYLLLVILVVINAIYFFFLHRKMRRRRVWFFGLYSLFFALTGFFFSMLLSSQLVIYTFMIIWSLLYGIYLEAIFNYIYRTEQTTIFDLKSISAYISILLLFVLAATLNYFHLFLSFSWYWLVIIYGVGAYLILIDRLLTHGFIFKDNLLYSSVVVLILLEIFGILLWWPVSMYVSSFLIAAIGYLMMVIITLKQQEKLTIKTALRYASFTTLIVVIVLVTAQWL